MLTKFNLLPTPKTKIMNTQLNIIKFFSIVSFIGLVYCCYDWYRISEEIKLLEETSARMEFLISEGYSLEAAKHITNVEFGIIPADEEYQALIED